MPIGINGSGNISGISAGGLPDYVIVTDDIASGAVTQAKLGTGVAGNGPAFSAYQNSSQTVSVNTWTKVSFQAENFDTSNCYDTATYRFTPNVAGYYQLSGGVSVNTSSCVIYAAIYKNGSSEKILQYSGPTVPAVFGSTLIYLNGTTDYVELYTYLTTGQSLTASSNNTYFQGALARAA